MQYIEEENSRQIKNQAIYLLKNKTMQKLYKKIRAKVLPKICKEYVKQNA